MLDYAAGPPSVGQSGPDLYMGGGEPIARARQREAPQPHTAMEHVGSSNSGLSTSLATALVVLAPLPSRGRLFVCWLMSGILQQT